MTPGSGYVTSNFAPMALMLLCESARPLGPVRCHFNADLI